MGSLVRYSVCSHMLSLILFFSYLYHPFLLRSERSATGGELGALGAQAAKAEGHAQAAWQTIGAPDIDRESSCLITSP